MSEVISITKEDFDYPIEKYDLEIVNGYLDKVKKRSNGSYRNNKGALRRCLNYIKKEIPKITMLDVKRFLENDIDKDTKLSLDSKENYRSYIKSFFYYVQSMLLSENIDFRNPTPINKVFEFTQKESDIKKISESKGDIYTDKELIDILELSKKHDSTRRDFIIFGILISTGMRISEALTIKLENINLKERYIETGFVMDARKSKKGLLFFIRENFKPYLERYINYLGNKSIWLFPGNNTHLLPKSFYNYSINNYGNEYARFHTFRRTMITNLVKNNCPLLISEMLMNHKASSVEGEHYVKLSIKEKRDLYDKYFPYPKIQYF